MCKNMYRNHRLTMALPCDVVFFADEFVVVEDVQLLTRGQLFSTDHAGETVEVEHFVPGLPHQVAGRDALGAAVALGAIPPETHRTFM